MKSMGDLEVVFDPFVPAHVGLARHGDVVVVVVIFDAIVWLAGSIEVAVIFCIIPSRPFCLRLFRRSPSNPRKHLVQVRKICVVLGELAVPLRIDVLQYDQYDVIK